MQTYRFSGLIAVLGLVALLVGLSVMLAFPDIQLAAWGILLLGVLLLATAFVMDYRRVGQALTGRRGRFGVGATVMASIFVGITMVINAISIGNYHRFDLTGVAQFTLTSQTKETLSQLEMPIKALGFFTPADFLRSYTNDLLTEYAVYTEKLSFEFIDPDEHPDQARQYGIAQYQTVVFESEHGYRLVSPQEIVDQAEHAFTSAILEVTGTVQKKIYFLTGHGESNIDSTTSSGYSRARDGLRDNLYRVDTIDLVINPSIPDDLIALIVAAPQRSLADSEIEIIERYLEDDGWVMVLLNPNPQSEIRQLLSPWGVEIEDGIIIDTSSYVEPNVDNPSVPRTRNFFGLSVSYFPGSTAIIPQQEVAEELQLIPLAWTSRESWLERNFDPNEEPGFDQGTEEEGPLALGVLVTIAPPETEGEVAPEMSDTRLIIFGDSDFASNQHFYNGDNADLFLNSVNLLTAGTELISIERKVLPFRRMIVGPLEARFINYSSVALLPVIILLAGGIIWWRRR
jgi:ABC-type uncharacterized transport system involved in gliding motility auxiliary subunit